MKESIKYFLINLSGITYESISSCNSLLDFLVGRLKKQSPHIKYKVRIETAENIVLGCNLYFKSRLIHRFQCFGEINVDSKESFSL